MTQYFQGSKKARTVSASTFATPKISIEAKNLLIE